MNNTDSITSKQLIFIIIGSQIAGGIFSLPRLVSAAARQDAWIAAFLGVMFPLLILLIIERLGRRMPESNFVNMNQRLLGPWLGSCMVFLFIVYVIFFQAVVVRIFSEITNVFLLPRTPLPVIVLLVMLGAVYVINKGARVVARVNEILFWVILPSLLLILTSLVNADYTNLLPVGEAGLSRIARGTLSSSFAYGGIEVLLVFYFLVNRKEEVIKAGILGLGFTALVYMVFTLIALLVLGSETMQLMNWPVLTLLKTVKFSVLERPELLMLVIWMGLGIRPTINLGFSAAYSLSEVLHLQRDKHFHLAVLFIALLIYILALLPSDIVTAFKLGEYAGYAFLLGGIGYPLLMLIVAVLRRKEAKNV